MKMAAIGIMDKYGELEYFEIPATVYFHIRELEGQIKDLEKQLENKRNSNIFAELGKGLIG